MKVRLLAGTRKGCFLFESGLDRRDWRLVSSAFEGWSVPHVSQDPRNGDLYAAVNSPSGPGMIGYSRDGGHTWSHSNQGIGYGKTKNVAFRKVWHVRAGHPDRPGDVWAGVEDAGLFRSRDNGETWTHMAGLRAHPSSDLWTKSGGGLVLHTVIVDRVSPHCMWTAVSAGGVYSTGDGGLSWNPANRGVPVGDWVQPGHTEAGHRTQKIVLGAAPGLLYQQNYLGVFRSGDFGDTWTDISEGLPSRFGFAIAAHPRHPDTAWVVPLISPECRWVPEASMAVWRTRDAGASWTRLTRGLPDRDAYLTVLREGLASDPLDPAGVYLITSTGQIFASADEGDSWNLLAAFLPPGCSLEAALVE